MGASARPEYEDEGGGDGGGRRKSVSHEKVPCCCPTVLETRNALANWGSFARSFPSHQHLSVLKSQFPPDIENHPVTLIGLISAHYVQPAQSLKLLSRIWATGEPQFDRSKKHDV